MGRLHSRARRFSSSDIERIATKLQRKLWTDRASCSLIDQNDDPVGLLDPISVLKALGYTVQRVPLGSMRIDGSQVKVAGTIDKESKEVQLSDSLESGVLQFTAAHELGHAILHEQSGMHRDRPMDGGYMPTARAPEELEADQFAVNFLMPRKLVAREFSLRFRVGRFEMTTENLYFLSPSEHHRIARDRRQVARMLSEKIVRSNHGMLMALTERFGVSKEAMAIRLEELGIV